MSRRALRILVYLALALAPFANRAEAGVGDISGVASLFERFSPAQRAQFSGDCWYLQRLEWPWLLSVRQ
jgi:hypothetical protein